MVVLRYFLSCIVWVGNIMTPEKVPSQPFFLDAIFF